MSRGQVIILSLRNAENPPSVPVTKITSARRSVKLRKAKKSIFSFRLNLHFLKLEGLLVCDIEYPCICVFFSFSGFRGIGTITEFRHQRKLLEWTIQGLPTKRTNGVGRTKPRKFSFSITRQFLFFPLDFFNVRRRKQSEFGARRNFGGCRGR